jgi:hypothetical protein
VLLQNKLFRFRQLACQGPVEGCFGVHLEIHAGSLQATISPSSRRRR